MNKQTASRTPAHSRVDARHRSGPHLSLLLSTVFIAAGLLSPDLQAAPDDAQRLASTVCANCHSLDGNSANPSYPKLAGQHASYIAKQLREFNAQTRAHDEMTPVAAKLSPGQIDDIAAYFNAKAPAPGTPGDPAVAELGRSVYLQGSVEAGLPSCDGCHGADGSGSPRFPRLAGQHPSYLFKQLRDIKHGRRTSSQLMRAVAERMTDGEMYAVSVFLGGL